MAIGEKTKYGKILAEWKVPEYIKYDKSIVWYVGAIALGLILLVHAIITSNFLFVIIILLVSSIVFIHERRHPDMIDFLILEGGIVMGDKFYPYKNIESFWIIYEPPHIKLLYLGLTKSLRKELPIHLENQNPVKIRKILLDYLEEDLDKEEEATEEGLSRLFKM